MNELTIFEDKKKLQLLKDTICRGATDDEFNLFIYTCKRLGLDPAAKQIYMVKRWDSGLKREAMTIQTSIDGYRLIAERTGKYAPGRETEYRFDDKGRLLSATAYVKKQTPDGIWHECAYTAFLSEYCQVNKEGKPIALWAKMPSVMLAKVAESACLRRCFPLELSGIYTKEEMTQSENPALPEIMPTITISQEEEIYNLIGDDGEFKDQLFDRLKKAFGMDCWSDLPQDKYPSVISCINKHNAERLKKEME